jgi:hypothetical protein
MGKKVIRLNGTDRDVAVDANVESTARDHREISCIAGGAGDDREVRIKPMNDPEEALREERRFAMKQEGKAGSGGERDQRKSALAIVDARGVFSGKICNCAQPSINMQGRLSVAAIHVEAAALARVGVAAQIAVGEGNLKRRYFGLFAACE